MPAKSVSQQKLMGMVHKCQKTGECASKKIEKISKNISSDDAKDFAKTKHKGLPKHKTFKDFIEEIQMKSFEQWKENMAQGSDKVWGSSPQIGPQVRQGGQVASASGRFDRAVGDQLGDMPLNKKLRYFIDTIQSMTGNEQDVMRDRQLLAKLKTAITRLDGILRSQDGSNLAVMVPDQK